MKITRNELIGYVVTLLVWGAFGWIMLRYL